MDNRIIFSFGDLLYFLTIFLPGRVAQSVTCLATDACLTADPVEDDNSFITWGPELEMFILILIFQ